MRVKRLSGIELISLLLLLPQQKSRRSTPRTCSTPVNTRSPRILTYTRLFGCASSISAWFHPCSRAPELRLEGSARATTTHSLRESLTRSSGSATVEGMSTSMVAGEGKGM